MFGHSIEYVAILIAADSIIRKISVFIFIIFFSKEIAGWEDIVAPGSSQKKL
jgi:hypothetical protein